MEKETPTEEWEGWFRERHSIKATAWREEDVIKARLVERFWNERQLGDMVEDIKSILTSHDAELRRKIEGMKKDDVEDESVETREQAVHIIQNRACNKTLDAVLALLDNKNV